MQGTHIKKNTTSGIPNTRGKEATSAWWQNLTAETNVMVYTLSQTEREVEGRSVSQAAGQQPRAQKGK